MEQEDKVGIEQARQKIDDLIRARDAAIDQMSRSDFYNHYDKEVN